jgi:Mg/Co/Ni transporter MgtE
MGTLSIKFAEQFPELFALELKGLPVRDTADVLNRLPDRNVLAVMTHLESSQLEGVVAGSLLTTEQLFAESTLDQASVLLTRLPKDLALVLVNSVTNKAKQRELRRYLNYPAHSVGAVVSKPTLQYKSTDLVSTVIADLAKLDDQAEPTLLVIDSSGKYLGVLETWQLIPAMASNISVAALVSEVEPLLAEIDHTAALSNPLWQSRSWLPVVDYQHRLIGICRQVHLAQEHQLDEPAPPHVLASSVQAMVGQMFHVLLSFFDLLLNRSKH